MARLTKHELMECQAQWENGVTAADLAEQFQVSERTIKRYRARGKWDRERDGLGEETLQKAKERVNERIELYLAQEETALKAAVAKSMSQARESVTEVLERHKDFSHRLAHVMEREITNLETNPDPNPSKRLSHIKTASEVISSIQRIERKTWGIDDKADASDLDQILMEIEQEEARRTEEVN
jgi:hypothetical protein